MKHFGAAKGLKAEDLGGFIFKDTEIPSIFIAIIFLNGDR